MNNEQHLQRSLTAIFQWLEKNQPDVFRRGLWDAISQVELPDDDSAEEAAYQQEAAERYSDYIAVSPQHTIVVGVEGWRLEMQDGGSGNWPIGVRDRDNDLIARFSYMNDAKRFVALDATPSKQQPQSFEEWWESDGQYVRAGGGDYEKCFAYAAWNATKSATPSEAAPAGAGELATLMAEFPELNMSNYSNVDVERLNDWGIQVVTAYRLAAQPTKE